MVRTDRLPALLDLGPLTQRRLLLAIDVVSMNAMNPPAAITMPGTLITNLPQPPTISGVTPIIVMESPMAMASTAMDRMIHFRLLAGSTFAAGDALAAGALATAGRVDFADDAPARGAAAPPAPLVGG